MDPEVESLLGVGAEDHDGLAVLGHLQHAVPQFVSHARSDTADEYARADLEKRSSEKTSEPGWAGGQDDDYHDTSSA